MEYLAIGNIRTSHGVKGLLKVRSLSGEVDHFFDLEEVILKDQKGREKQLTVEKCLPNGDELLIKFKGIETPELAKTYAGWEIWVPRDKAAPCEEGEFYYADLTGCRLYHGDQTLGTVISVTDGGGGTLLLIERAGGDSFFVPFRNEFIGDVDVKEKKIELKELWIAEE